METTRILTHDKLFSSLHLECIKSQGGAIEDEVRNSDGGQVPQSSTAEEQAPVHTNSETTPGSDVDEGSSSDESFYCGLEGDSASGDGA